MVGRSLFSILAIAVAIQSCVAQGALPHGKYLINRGRSGGLPLTVEDAKAGADVTLNLRFRNRVWEVTPMDGRVHEVSIRLDSGDNDLYAAPVEKENLSPVILSEDKFSWRLIGGDGGGYIVERADSEGPGRLVLSQARTRIFPPRLDTEYLRADDGYQRWFFTRLDDDLDQGSRPHCGQKKIHQHQLVL
ncbi:hypothetical protein B0O80DRAFT_466789 [Mortierella sp. GBAus27b]|nr:hypothetical protein B0O80DRAFT_466789 [Mortierella sp. GBAus27b]